MRNHDAMVSTIRCRAGGCFRWTTRSLLVAALSFTAIDAWASNASATESSSTEAQYRQAIDEAIAAFEAAHLDRARAAFERAHALSPSARTWRGIGITAFEQQDYAAASSALRAALEDTRKPLTAEQRAEVQDLLTKAGEHLGRGSVRTIPEEAREQEGSDDPAGDRHAAPLELDASRKKVPAQTLAVRTETAAKSAVPAVAPPERRGRLWTWVALGAAPVLASVSAGIWLSGLSDADRVRSCGCSDAERARRADAAGLPAKETWTAITAASAAAALGGAVVLYFVEGSGERASLGVGVTGTGVFVRGTL